jgi:hypothetical protein
MVQIIRNKYIYVHISDSVYPCAWWTVRSLQCVTSRGAVKSSTKVQNVSTIILSHSLPDCLCVDAPILLYWIQLARLSMRVRTHSPVLDTACPTVYACTRPFFCTGYSLPDCLCVYASILLYWIQLARLSMRVRTHSPVLDTACQTVYACTHQFSCTGYSLPDCLCVYAPILPYWIHLQ